MAYFDFNNDSVCEMFDELIKVPAKIPEALERMGENLQGKLRKNAPYDGSERHRDKHLKEVITKTKVKSKNGEHYITIFVNPRGIKNPKKSRKGINWDKDKHVFKLVVAEYGSSKQAKKPFWKPTVEANADETVEIGREVLLSEVDRIAK